MPTIPSRKRALAAGTLALLGAASCGKSTPGPTPALSLAVTPNPVTFSVLPPNAPPRASIPPCCPTLVAGWTLVVTPTTEGDLVSATVTLHNRATGFLYVNRQFDARQLATQVPTHVQAGAPVSIRQALLETMPSRFSAAEPLLLRVEVAFRSDGQTVTSTIEPAFNQAR
jgi:hypothetical protein